MRRSGRGSPPGSRSATTTTKSIHIQNAFIVSTLADRLAQVKGSGAGGKSTGIAFRGSALPHEFRVGGAARTRHASPPPLAPRPSPTYATSTARAAARTQHPSRALRSSAMKTCRRKTEDDPSVCSTDRGRPFLPRRRHGVNTGRNHRLGIPLHERTGGRRRACDGHEMKDASTAKRAEGSCGRNGERSVHRQGSKPWAN